MGREVSPSSIGAPIPPQPHHDDFWIVDPSRFDIDLDSHEWTKYHMANFETRELRHKTCLQLITAKKNELNSFTVQNSFLDDDESMKLGRWKEGNVDTFELISISRMLQKEEDATQLPDEEYYMFRVSSRVLRHLAFTYRLPSAFLVAASRPSDIFGTVFRRQSKHEWYYWCLIPCRAVTTSESTDMFRSPLEKQMSPFNDIHFENQKVGITRYTVALYIKRDSETRTLRVLVVNTADTWARFVIQEPLARIQNGLEQGSSIDLDGSPCFVVLVYIANILGLWDGVFPRLELELINHQRKLQKEIENDTKAFLSISKDLNAALHAIAAHLHRYKTELQCVGPVLSDLRKYRREMTYKPKPKKRDEGGIKEDDDDELSPIDRELEKIEQLSSQLAAMSSFVDEIERKVQNILALLFNQIQATNDKTLQAILSTSQEETRISQKLSLASHMLSRSMKRDSIAMKTIAIMTLVFLPGATFAAVFAMPFFTENEHLSSPSQVWIWVILTMICTTFAFGGYIHLVKRGEMTLGDPEDDSDIVVSSDGATASHASSVVSDGQNTSSHGN